MFAVAIKKSPVTFFYCRRESSFFFINAFSFFFFGRCWLAKLWLHPSRTLWWWPTLAQVPATAPVATACRLAGLAVGKEAIRSPMRTLLVVLIISLMSIWKDRDRVRDRRIPIGIATAATSRTAAPRNLVVSNNSAAHLFVTKLLFTQQRLAIF